jgi:enoyl-CoA hydratase
MEASNGYIRVEHHESIAELILDRPETNNAFGPAMSEDLFEAVEHLEESDVGVTVVRASDDIGTFCVGVDLALEDDPFLETVQNVQTACRRMYTGSVVYVAAVRNAALGGGFELALVCDIRLAEPDTTLGLPEVSLGVFPASGGTRLLTRMLGEARAKELILTAERFDGETARELGLVADTVSDGLREETRALARTVAESSPRALAAAKQSIHDAVDRSYESGLERDFDPAERLVRGPAFRDSREAFRQRRE